MAKRIAYNGMFIALALVFGYVEYLIPINFGIPGVKIGLSNIVTVIGLYFMSPIDTAIVLIARILLSGLLFGNFLSILYSLVGGILSFAVMFLLRKIKIFTASGVSIAGSVSHNIGQIIVAIFLVQNINIIYYLPVLLISGVLMGFLIGIISGRVVDALNGNTLQK